ncbi:hypothetical protein ACTMS2_04455 [Micromonospora sp. SD12]|uniref:hypothetical protein n=1 Tax=Micromonospora sp. SD12 TaxID=3452216 RepID=UPI003F8A89AD
MPTALSASGPSPTAGNDLYEAFLFTVVLKAAAEEGFEISFEDGSNLPPTIFRLRRSPGRLPTGGSFTHAVLTLPNSQKDPLEVHTGIAVIGRSKVAHEADVIVLPQSNADRCRQLGIDPPSSSAILTVEGKYYTTPVSLGMGRQFLGLAADLSKKCIFAATVTSSSLVHLLEGRRQEFEVGVLPGRKAELDLQARFAIALRSYRQRR